MVDENVHLRIVAFLRVEGHDVLSVSESFPNVSDDEVLRRANEEDRILITHDTDFGEMIFHRGFGHKGVILIRPGNERFEKIRNGLMAFLEKKSEHDIRDKVWSIGL